MLRVHAIGAGAVGYLLRGSGCADRDKQVSLDDPQDRDRDEPELGRDPHQHAQDRERGGDREREGGAAYLARAEEHREPAGVWLGEGMAALGLAPRAGEEAREGDVVAIFGQLRRPESSAEDPDYIGSKPRTYRTGEQRLAELRKQEPEATPERVEELEMQAAASGRRPVAYYDLTFSPVKSISVYYASLVAAGDLERAEAVRAAHEEAVGIAIEYAQTHVAYTRLGRHGSARDGSGRSVGEFVKGTGLSVIAFTHHTNRESEPQLHTHAGVLNRLAVIRDDGSIQIGALDGKGFGPVKEAVATAYERAVEQLVTEATGAVFETRPDGKAREIAGIDPELMAEASTRRSQVLDRAEELVEGYRARHGREPDAAARKHIADMAAYETRRPKDGLSGPAGVAAWGQDRQAWCTQVLDQVDAAAAADRARRGGGRLSGQLRAVSDRWRGRGGDTGDRSGQDRDRTPSQRDMSGREQGTSGRDEGMSGGPWAQAVAAGVAQVQARYASWTIGNLVQAIDRQLGPAAELGVPARDRPAVVEALARGALSEGGHGVVQLTGHEPVLVPESLRRVGDGEDGRPAFRPHIDERYATAAHLSTEHRVLERLAGTGAPTLGADRHPAVREALIRTGLSPDQAQAVLGIAGSGGRGDVLIGPAGTGKSRTLNALARTWTQELPGPDPDRPQRAARVFGVATSQAATKQLAGGGMTALNSTRFINALTPDQNGRIRDRLTSSDLIIIDEAGMADTAFELDTITRLAHAAGAKIVLAGDPGQLGAPGAAGGLFAHIATHLEAPDPAHPENGGSASAGSAQPGDGAGRVFTLAEVHRLAEEWERSASLRLREGDPSAIPDYAHRGRLHTGTIEDLTATAARAYLADTVAGKTSLLIVSTNDQASQVSDTIRQQRIALGLVQPTPLGDLADGNKVSVGDVIQARRNDYTLRVDPSRDAQGRSVGGEVSNREVYTVIGRGKDGTVLARDGAGAVAHLTRAYLKNDVVLGYATTVYGAQGASVDTAHAVLDRDATREALYVAATRGIHANLIYLVTDREPDTHDPQRLGELAAERLGDILSQRSAEIAAIDVRETPDQTSGLAALGARFEVVSRWVQREQHAAVLAEVLPVADAAALAREGAPYERLLRTLAAAQLDGHDPARLLAEAASQRELGTAEWVGDVLRWRIDGITVDRVPENPPGHDRPVKAPQGRHDLHADPHTENAHADGTARDWAARVPPGEGPKIDYLQKVAGLADQRQTEAATRAANEAPEWAVGVLGEAPDREVDPDGHARWIQAAGRLAAHRQVVGIDDAQTGIGSAPSRERELHRDLWRGAVDAAGHTPARGGPDGDPVGRAWVELDNEALYQVTEGWALALGQAPPWVGDELASTWVLAREYAQEAALEHARLARTDGADGADGQTLAQDAARHARFAEHHTAHARQLEVAHRARQQWWQGHTADRDAADAAADELTRRGLERVRDPQMAFDLDLATDRHHRDRSRDADPEPPAPDDHRTPQRPAWTGGRDRDRDDQPATPAERGRGQGDQSAQRGDRAGLVLEAEAAIAAREQAAVAFQHRLGVTHQQRLNQVDPDHRLDARDREAAARVANYQRFTQQLREQHGARLDPENRLDDEQLAHTRAAEIAAAREAQDAARAQTRAPQHAAVDPDNALTDTQRDALAWQRSQPSKPSQPVRDEPARTPLGRAQPDRAAGEPTTTHRTHPTDTQRADTERNATTAVASQRTAAEHAAPVRNGSEPHGSGTLRAGRRGLSHDAPGRQTPQPGTDRAGAPTPARESLDELRSTRDGRIREAAAAAERARLAEHQRAATTAATARETADRAGQEQRRERETRENHALSDRYRAQQFAQARGDEPAAADRDLDRHDRGPQRDRGDGVSAGLDDGYERRQRAHDEQQQDRGRGDRER